MSRRGYFFIENEAVGGIFSPKNRRNAGVSHRWAEGRRIICPACRCVCDADKAGGLPGRTALRAGQPEREKEKSTKEREKDSSLRRSRRRVVELTNLRFVRV